MSTWEAVTSLAAGSSPVNRGVYCGAEGEFGRLHPRGKRGAVELAVRYSTLDLNDLDENVSGGKGDNVTIGVNWYANSNVRLMTNYALVKNDPHATGNGDVKGDDDFSVLQFRFQVIF